MKNLQSIYRKIVVKVGSNVITGKDGELDLEILQSLTAQIAQLQKKGIQVILVSSGALLNPRNLYTGNFRSAPNLQAHLFLNRSNDSFNILLSY